MCTVAEDIEDLSATDCTKYENLQDARQIECNTCRKCGEPSVVLLQKKDPYCKSCFLVYCHHKFRATIGKAKQIKPQHKVLIACSGGLKSSAMIDMVMQALKESSHKKLLFRIGVLFIDESSIASCSEEINKALSAILKKIEDRDCAMLYSSIEMAFRDPDLHNAFYWDFTSKSQGEIPSNSKTRLLKSLSNIKSLTSKLDFLTCLKRQLMLDIAAAEKYTHLFVGDSATDLAIKFLADVAVGRGSQVSHNTAFYDTQYRVPICRPMREFLNKEIAFYNQLMEVVYVNQQTLLTKTDSQSSIQRLTETFVNGLQESFPATVFTIFRTGGKISSNIRQSEDNICAMCKSVRDNVTPAPCSAIASLALSSKLSTLVKESSVIQNEETDRLHDVFCHGCQIIMNELGCCSSLPPAIIKETSTKTLRSEMKDTIKDYLLIDED